MLWRQHNRWNEPTWKWCDLEPCRSHHNRQRGAVLIAMICAPVLIDVMMISYAYDYNCQILWCNQMLVIAIVDFVLRHKSIWNELWFVLWRKSMLWCNQMLCDCNCWLCAFATSHQYENEWCDPLLVINSMKDSEAYRIIDDPRFLLWY